MNDNTPTYVTAAIVGGIVLLALIASIYNYRLYTAAFAAGYEEGTVTGHTGTVWVRKGGDR